MSGPNVQDEQGRAPDPAAQARGAPDDPPPQAYLREAVEQAKEFKAYAAHYVTAKVDSVKLSVRKAVVLAALGVLALIALTALVVTGVVFAISGLAQALGALLGGRAWAGQLLAGGSVLGLLALGAWIGMKVVFSKSRRDTVKRYEQRLRQQRFQFAGHDSAQRSAESKAH